MLTFVLSTFAHLFCQIDYFCGRANTDFDWLLDTGTRPLVDLKFCKVSGAYLSRTRKINRGDFLVYK